MKYLVKIDKEGRMCWVKNGERISTSMDYKDSVDGIVPKDDSTPAYTADGQVEDPKHPRRSVSEAMVQSQGSILLNRANLAPSFL